MSGNEHRYDGADVLIATVRGNDIPALKLAARAKGRQLWGPGVLLAEHVAGIGTRSADDGAGAFMARVEVRIVHPPYVRRWLPPHWQKSGRRAFERALAAQMAAEGCSA